MNAALVASIDAALNTRVRIDVEASAAAAYEWMPSFCLAGTVVVESCKETLARAQRLGEQIRFCLWLMHAHSIVHHLTYLCQGDEVIWPQMRHQSLIRVSLSVSPHVKILTSRMGY
jgi:hypothetical protein